MKTSSLPKSPPRLHRRLVEHHQLACLALIEQVGELRSVNLHLETDRRHVFDPLRIGLMKLEPGSLHPLLRRKSWNDLDQSKIAFAVVGERAAEFFRLVNLGAPVSTSTD